MAFFPLYPAFLSKTILSHRWLVRAAERCFCWPTPGERTQVLAGHGCVASRHWLLAYKLH